LKTSKRAHLSADSVKKQAMIFEAYCAENTDIERCKFDDEATPYKFWTDDAFNKELGLLTSEREQEKPTWIDNRFIEDWEHGAMKKKDPVNEARLLKKYSGLKWFDPDTLGWKGGWGMDNGYSMLACSEDWDEKEPQKEDNEEPWAIFDGCVLH
jgi:hypothetical protein